MYSMIFVLDLHDQKLSAMSICGKEQDPQFVRDWQAGISRRIMVYVYALPRGCTASSTMGAALWF